MLEFIYKSPSNFNATTNISIILEQKGFKELYENQQFKIEKNGKYFIRRNDSSIIAFKIPSDLNNLSFNIVASHSDAPTFKLKPNNVIKQGGYILLNTEGYGGMIISSWFDRPLSVAGRVIVKTENGVRSEIVNVDKNLASICNLPIHFNRKINEGYKYNEQKDSLPIIGMGEKFDIKNILSKSMNIDKKMILNYDLVLYPRNKGYVWGANNEFLSSYHLDDLACAYTSLMAFVESENDNTINTFVCFDNEEVGSMTRQGAYSSFMYDNLKRVSKSLEVDLANLLSNTVLVSADNAHASHPNYEEKFDKINKCMLNGGLVIKNNASQSYTTDSLSSSILIDILNKNKQEYQFFANRSDVRGGSTLGNLSNSQVSVLAVDVGLAQLAMHSANETMGSQDITKMIDSLRAYYNTSIRFDGKEYKIK
jgi:aspartyl aminopeptidase